MRSARWCSRGAAATRWGSSAARICAWSRRSRRTSGSGPAPSWRSPSLRRWPRWRGATVDAPGLAQAAGRAARSAVGMWTFALGGLVVEGGVRRGAGAPGAAAGAPPDAGGVAGVLVVPKAEPGLSGAAEEDAFQRLVPSAERSAAIAQLVLTSLLPALVERDLEEFGAALTHVQQLVGDAFADVQGGRFHPRAAALVEALLRARGGRRRPELVGAGRLRRGGQRVGRTRARGPDGARARRRGERGAGARSTIAVRAWSGREAARERRGRGRGARGRRGGRRHRRRQEPGRGLARRAVAGGDRGRSRGGPRASARQRRDRRHAQPSRNRGARRARRGAQRRGVREGRVVGRLDRARGGRPAARGPRRLWRACRAP